MEAKKQRGRPRKFEHFSLVSFNIERELLKVLDEYCKNNLCERTGVISKAIINYLVKNDDKL